MSRASEPGTTLDPGTIRRLRGEYLRDLCGYPEAAETHWGPNTEIAWDFSLWNRGRPMLFIQLDERRCLSLDALRRYGIGVDDETARLPLIWDRREMRTAPY